MALITGLKGGTTNITVSYGGQTATVSNFTVNKKTVTFTAPTLKSVSAYTRSSQTLVNAGSCTTGGTMYYYVSTSSSTPTFSTSSWTTTVPSKTNAGTYYLWYCAYVSDTGAYTGTGINTVTKVGDGYVTIPKQTPVLSTSPTKKGDWSYNGTEYALASGGAMKHSSTDSTPVSGTFTYATAKEPGTYTASWSFTPTDTTNYNSTSGNVGTVTVSRADNPITISPTTATIYVHSSHTYNNTVQLSVSGAQGSVSYSSSDTGKATVNSSGLVTAKAAGTVNITATADGNTYYKSGTASCTVTIVTDTIYSYGNVTGTISISQIKDFPAGGVTLTTSNISTYFSYTKPCVQTNTWTSGYKSNGNISYSWSVSSGTVASKGTTISNAATVTINATVTATGEGNNNYAPPITVTSGTQAGNYVTAITAKSSDSNNIDGTHFSYANIEAGATSASPSLTGGALYTFSSGSTKFDTSSSPTFGGSALYTRSYSLASSQNGFTTVNSSTGVLTATSRGKNPGAERASANVTGTLVVKYTHASTYSAGGIVTSSTKSNTQTCTQNANYLTWGDPVLTVSSPATPYSMTVSGETKAITASATQSATYSSGATDTYTPDISYTVKTSKTGYSLSSNSVTVTNNTSTSARNGFVVTVTAKGKLGTDSTYEFGYNKTSTKDITFNQAAGTKVYANPVISHTTPVALSNAGQEYTMSPTFSQTYTWNGVSGSGGTITSGATYDYTVKTSKDGYSLSSGKVTVTNNKSTSARNGFVVTITCSVNSKTSTKDITFNQAAGTKVYAVPTISTYSYETYAAAGATKTPTVSYSQTWTWNGVSDSGGTITSGGTLAFTKGTLTSGATAGSSFATDGTITWGNNTTTSTRSTHSALNVTVTLNSKTSSAKACTSCTQSAGAKVYGTPTVTFTYTNTAASGATNKTPTTVTYSQPWTWNSVSGSGGNITSGLTLSYSTTGTLPTGFSKGTNFATTGAITWASRGTTVGSQLNANSNIVLSIPFADKTRTYNPTGCTQDANALTNTNYSPSNYTASVSIDNGMNPGGGSATVRASASHKAYDYYTSGSYNNQHTVTDSVTWVITTQTFTPSGGSASTITRFSKSNNTLSHTSMTSNVGTDYVKITATNSSNTSTTSTAEKSITNELGTQKYKNTSGTTGYNIVYNVPTVTIGSGLSAAGGSATVTCSVTNGTNWYQKYTSGTYTGQQTGTEAGTARWMITSNGNSRFSHPSSGGTSLSGVGTVYNTGTKISHSNMTTNATTDTVTVTAYNIGDISKTKTASASVSNVLTGISISLGSSSIKYNSTTTATVTATYTSGSSKDVTSSLSTSSSATSNYIKSGDTSVVTIS